MYVPRSYHRFLVPLRFVSDDRPSTLSRVAVVSTAVSYKCPTLAFIKHAGSLDSNLLSEKRTSPLVNIVVGSGFLFLHRELKMSPSSLRELHVVRIHPLLRGCFVPNRTYCGFAEERQMNYSTLGFSRVQVMCGNTHLFVFRKISPAHFFCFTWVTMDRLFPRRNGPFKLCSPFLS